MVSRTSVVVCLVAVFSVVRSQLIQQCTCATMQTCSSVEATILSCSNRCQHHAAAMGAAYPAARQCVLSHQAQITQAVNCARNNLGNTCAANTGGMVVRRFPETIQLAAFREINGILSRSGLIAQATTFLQSGRRFFGCVLRCGQQQSCARTHRCGLQLPTDNAIVATVKGRLKNDIYRCLLGAGFTTPAVRGMCNCLVNAGIQTLAPICNNLIIS